MVGADGRPFLARVRARLLERVQALSLRQVARELRVTPTGLQYFLDGGDPQERTRRKLEGWYLWTEAGLDQSAGDELEHIALAVFVRGLPPAERAVVVGGALSSMEEAYARAGLSVPKWVSDLRERFPTRV